MRRVRIVSDRDECRQLWKRYYPSECLFDLWEVRQCFDDQFRRSVLFFVSESGGRVTGLLPLSWIDEEKSYGFFPGETWKGKTWLEQNKILASDPGIAAELLNAVEGDLRLRYMGAAEQQYFETEETSALEYDETGYRFYPDLYGWSYSRYLESVPLRTRKKLMKDVRALTSCGVRFRYDSLDDVDKMFRLNIESYGSDSYFSDQRFYGSFENLIRWLYDNKMLRVVTVLSGDDVAAVDVGAVWQKQCTMIAGGTHQGYKGVAKLINFHHIQWACRKKIASIDFLCGDFGWKERFRLTPVPFYKLDIKRHVAAA